MINIFIIFLILGFSMEFIVLNYEVVIILAFFIIGALIITNLKDVILSACEEYKTNINNTLRAQSETQIKTIKIYQEQNLQKLYYYLLLEQDNININEIQPFAINNSIKRLNKENISLIRTSIEQYFSILSSLINVRS